MGAVSSGGNLLGFRSEPGYCEYCGSMFAWAATGCERCGAPRQKPKSERSSTAVYGNLVCTNHSLQGTIKCS